MNASTQPEEISKTATLIVAAGRGRRAGGGIPKQYRDLNGRALLAWTAEAFSTHPDIAEVRVVIHPDDRELYDAALKGCAGRERIGPPVHGGAERQDSVRLGLEALEDSAPGAVLIHDAARPFIDGGTIGRVITALDAASGAVAALPIFDTVKRAHPAAGEDPPLIAGTTPRDHLWRAQTPQGFRFTAILDAHRKAAGQALTDDAAVAEAAGLDVALVVGAPDNMKITQAEDFGLAGALLARTHPNGKNAHMEYRTGQGFDVHAFAEGDRVTICGVEIRHTHRLSGHSDADVGMHALTDALFGALADGDIGAHFPPSDPQWKGAASHIFLEKARDRVAQAGGRITHCDVTLICEVPKIGPHRDAMRTALAEILRIDPGRVSVKATTTEKLGFTGRKEGIAAQATATIALPL